MTLSGSPPGAHRAVPVRRRWGFSSWWWAAFAAVACALVVATVLALQDDRDPGRTTAGAPIVPATPLTTSAAVPSPAPDLPEGAFAGDGHYIVGTEIAPGKYTASGPSTPGVPGVWARCRIPAAADAPPCATESDVIDSGRSVGQPTVTLRAGQIFETRGFREWRRV